MARCRDLRDGTAQLEFYEASVTLADGTVKTYQIQKQPMPKLRKPVQEAVEFPIELMKAISRRPSKHAKGWHAGPSTAERRESRRVSRQARKLHRQYI